MRALLLVLLLTITTQQFSQTKYYIYFKDKGIEQTGVLKKSSKAFQSAEKLLSAEAIERRKQVMGENYITEEDVPINENYVKQIEALGLKIENKLRWFNAVTAYASDELIDKIKLLPFVEKVEIVRSVGLIKPTEDKSAQLGNVLQKTSGSTSLNYGQSLTQNALSDVPAVHDLGITGKGVYIGILDCGFNWKTHKALSSRNVVKWYDYVGKDLDVSDGDNHGTAVFSMLGGYDPGNVIGPSFDSQFFLARTENVSSESKAEEDNYAAALEDMEAAGVQITSASLGYNEFDNAATNYTYKDMNGNTAISTKAVNLAFQRGIFLVNAAGNEGNKTWKYITAPSDAFNVITVGAVDKNNAVASFSSRGPSYDGRIKPEIVAMGVSNYYAVTGGTYGSGNGTSYATPIVGGIAGLLKSCWPHLTNVQMRQIFLECGDYTASPNNDRGYGLLSAKKVIAYPNLQSVTGGYQLNKIFINSAGVNSSTVKVYYKMGSGNFQSSAMNYDGSLKYSFAVPTVSYGSVIEFYFEYNTTGGTLVREPVDANYSFVYGSMSIKSILKDIQGDPPIPEVFLLLQNYPNPFNPSTTIIYKLATASNVTLKVFDLLGREVATLVDEFKQPGTYQTSFNASHLERSRVIASGVFFYQLRTDKFTETKKMLLMK